MSIPVDPRVRPVVPAHCPSSSFVCADPVRAACRLLALIDGLAVQRTVHDDVMPRARMLERIHDAAGRSWPLMCQDGIRHRVMSD
jgi:BetI-type transcriptional repressor, C-terminal